MKQDDQELQDKTKRDDTARPSRHVWIMRGVVTPVFGLLAVTFVILGWLNATIWKPSKRIESSTTVSSARYVMTDPGVLPLVDSHVTVTATASGSGEICIATGAGKDANGWVSGASYTRVTGLSDWSTLSTEQATSKGSATEGVAFKDSDMWTSVTCANGKATLSANVTSKGEVALIDLSDSASNAVIRLDWERQTLPDFATPMYFVGGLLAVCGVLSASVFAMPPHKRRRQADLGEQAGEAESAASRSWASIHAEQGHAGFGITAANGPRRKRRRHAARRVGSATAAVMEQAASDATAAAAGIAESAAAVQTAVPASAPSGPVIIDPANRNLVAEAAASASTSAAAASQSQPHDTTRDSAADAQPSQPRTETSATVADRQETSVITPDELQAYFARLAQEVGDSTNETTTSETRKKEADRS